MKNPIKWLADFILTPDSDDDFDRPAAAKQIGNKPHVKFQPILEYMKSTAATPDRVDQLGDGIYAHNKFTVVTSPEDMDRLEKSPVILKKYIQDLEIGMTTFYKAQKFLTFSPIKVSFSSDQSYGKGRFHVESEYDASNTSEDKQALDNLKTVHKTVFKTVGPPQGQKLAVLTVTQGSQKGEVFAIKKPTVHLGRVVPGNTPDIEIVDKLDEVSRRHATIEETEEGYSLTDTESNNGTKLNGEKLTPLKAYPLTAGDHILLADNVELLFELKDSLRQAETK